MTFNEGDKVLWRTLYGREFYEAEVQLVQDSEIRLSLTEAPEGLMEANMDVVIRIGIEDYFTQVLKVLPGVMVLRPLWCERRRYFRVDDTFPVVSRKITGETVPHKPKLFSGRGIEAPSPKVTESDTEEDTKIWRKLSSISTKLGLVLYALEVGDEESPSSELGHGFVRQLDEVDAALGDIVRHLNMGSEDLSRADSSIVNISATGMRFTTTRSYSSGDTIEIRMLLPLSPPIGVLVVGSVIRGREAGQAYEISLDFGEMSTEVRDTIIQYTLERQREVIRAERMRAVEA